MLPNRGRPMPYPNNYPPPQCQNQQPPPQPPAQPPPPADPPKTTSTSTVVQPTKPATSVPSGPPPANGQSNTNTNIQSSGPPPSQSRPAGGPMRGRGTMTRGRGGYNPNINVTGGDMQQQDQNKPYYRNPSTRGGRGGFVQGLSRQGPASIQTNHQPPSGMQSGGIGNGPMPVKRGPPVSLPGPKRGNFYKNKSNYFQEMINYYFFL